MISVNNKKWLEKETPNNLIELLMDSHSISYLLARVLLNRGITPENSQDFFNGKLKNSMPNPYFLKDMNKAVELTKQIILQKKSICILGDYDVDGMTSVSLLHKYLNYIGNSPSYYIPNRFTEGYGGSEASVSFIIKKNPQLIIMVDNGSSSHNLVNALLEQNKQVVIIDHHAIELNMPNANAIVNPARIDDNSNLNYLCSAGIVFLFLVALNRELINCSFLNKNNNHTAYLLSLLDLVALATVCDMVPLIGINRVFVKQGLIVLSKREHVGLESLLEVLSFNNKVNTDTLGFTLGPAINAASRMGKEEMALKLLISDNKTEALKLAINLKESNIDRQKAEDLIIKSATEKLNSKEIKENFIFLGSNEWSQGIVGIIAGRIKEMHNKPTCIYSINLENNTATASGRSVSNIDLGSVVLAAKQEGLLVKGGGHSQAVGFSFNLDLKDKIFEFFNKNIKLQIARKKIDNTLFIDYNLALSAINTNLIKELLTLEPFGTAFLEPLFRISSVFINNVRPIGRNRNHLSFDVSDGLRKVKGICFKAIPSKLGDTLCNISSSPVDIIVGVKGNFYKGNIYPNLILFDINTKR